MAEDYSVRAILSAYDKGFSSAMKSAASQAQSLDRGMGSMIKTGGLLRVGMMATDKAIGTITSHMGAAVDRFDTIKKFPKVMEQLGFSAKDASDVMEQKLGPAIDGLPTAMDEIVASTQQIALITGDLEGAADTATALNDAFLSSGSSAWDASRGLTQYTQMLTTGKVDMQSWRTLLETMSPALNKVAKSFGYTGATAKNELYQALKDGDITFDELNKRIIELDKGTNGFAEQARTQSTGIKTSFQNIGTAVTKGLANSITAIEELSKSSGLGGIAENADRVKAKINAAFSAINDSISKIDLKGIAEAARPYWDAFNKSITATAKFVLKLTNFLLKHAGAIAKVAPAVIGVIAAYKGLNAIPSIIKRLTLFIDLAKASTLALKTNALASVGALKRGYDALSYSIYKVSLSSKKATAFTKAFTVAQKVLNAVMRANPFILIASLIIVIVTALSVLEAKGMNVAQTITNFADTFAAKIEQVAAKLPTVIEAAVQAIMTNMPKIIAAGAKIIVALAKGIIKSIPIVVKSIPRVITAILKAFKTIGKSMLKVGADLITGLWNGIGNKVGWLKSKISGFVGNVKAWLKRFFKIGSPSRLMAKEIGQYLPMGIAAGFDAKASVVMQSVRSLSQQMSRMAMPMPSFAGGLSDEYSYGGATIEVPLYIDGREFAKATASYTEAAQNTLKMRKDRKMGIR